MSYLCWRWSMALNSSFLSCQCTLHYQFFGSHRLPVHKVSPSSTMTVYRSCSLLCFLAVKAFSLLKLSHQLLASIHVYLWCGYLENSGNSEEVRHNTAMWHWNCIYIVEQQSKMRKQGILMWHKIGSTPFSKQFWCWIRKTHADSAYGMTFCYVCYVQDFRMYYTMM